MLSKTELWDKLGQFLKDGGFELFDIDLPHPKSLLVKVYITKPTGNVGIDECSTIARELRKDGAFDGLLDGYDLEVSSPGINRRLTRPEHFLGALGERIKVVMKFGPHSGQVVFGKLIEFAGSEGRLEVEPAVSPEDKKRKPVPVAPENKVFFNFNLSDLKTAQIDFIF